MSKDTGESFVDYMKRTLDDMSDEDRDNIWTLVPVGSKRESPIKNPCNMRVKCINNEKNPFLTKGHIYEVSSERDQYYYFHGDIGKKGGFYKHRFEILEDYDEMEKRDISKLFEEKVKQMQDGKV